MMLRPRFTAEVPKTGCKVRQVRTAVDMSGGAEEAAAPGAEEAGLDGGLLQFSRPHCILYGTSILEQRISVTNDSAPSYIDRGPCGRPGGRDGAAARGGRG
jgi:hypothetical protein